MSDHVYNCNKDSEVWCFDEIEEAIEDFLANEDEGVSGVITVYQGDKVKYKASSFVPNILDNMADSAAGEVDDFAEDWYQDVKLVEKELQKNVEDLVDSFFTELDLQPKFYSVSNIVPLQVKYAVDDCGSVTVIDDGSKG